MKNIRTIINEAEAKGYDVIITDEVCCLVRTCDKSKWEVMGELGWYNTEEEVDSFVVVRVEEYKDDKEFYIVVEDTNQ